MKILVVQESDWIKRNPHQQHHLMEQLSMRGHDIRVIDHRVDYKDNKELFQKREEVDEYYKINPQGPIKVIRPSIINLPIIIYGSIIFSHQLEIARQINEFKPDIIVGFGIINTYLASKIAKKNNIPFVYYWIDVLHRLIPEKLFRVFGEYLEKITIKNSTQIITINHKLEDYVKGLGAENTLVVSAGINLEKFDPTLKGTKIREEYAIKNEDTVLFFMGFLYHFSGLKEVVKQFANIKSENLKLLIVGDGDAYLDLQNIIEDYDLKHNVLLVGKKSYNEIPEFLAAADICILPAYPDEEIMRDIVPIKIYEYMGMGKPVITTQLPGIIKEFGFENGIFYVDKPEKVIDKALNINIQSNGQRARNFVKNNDWESITSYFEDNLNILVTKKA